jgi:hypothetical protein
MCILSGVIIYHFFDFFSRPVDIERGFDFHHVGRKDLSEKLYCYGCTILLNDATDEFVPPKRQSIKESIQQYLLE